MPQSAFVVHALVHICAAVSHLGAAGSVQSALVTHPTHWPVPVSHTSMAAWQSVLLVQPLHVPFLQKGVAPPHCASVVHVPPPPLLLLVVPVLVVVIPLLVVVLPLLVVVTLVLVEVLLVVVRPLALLVAVLPPIAVLVDVAVPPP
jgi:hypothetical protein